MARHKQQPMGQFGRKDLRHGLNAYKVYACRCTVCKAAMSAYGKSRYVPKTPAPKAEPQTLQSWWIGKSRTELAANVQTEQARMSASRITGRVSVPDGWR